MNFIEHIGKYFIFLGRTLRKPEKVSVFRSMTMKEIDILGLNSLPIVSVVSVFVGAVVALQTAFNMESPLFPDYLIGLAVRDSVILEFSPTMVSLILAGKVGSNIASNIGFMRASEQIDALEVMGINSANYLVLPKIISLILVNPMLIVLSMALCIVGGWIAGEMTGFCPTEEYIYGIQYEFRPFNVAYALIKTVVFAFVIATISAYQGYYTRGGALEVGNGSTRAVVFSSMLIIFLNYVLTQIFLTN